MNRYPLLRAYMAGVLFPSWFLMLVMAGLEGIQPTPPVDFERVLLFALATVPNLWGLWNLLYFATGMKRRLPLGAWGGLLPLLIIPIGVAFTRGLDLRFIQPMLVLGVAPVAMGVYFLIWKFAVSFFNRVVGLD